MRRFVALLAAACLAFGVSSSTVVCLAEEEPAETELTNEDQGDDGELKIATSFESVPGGAEEITYNYKGEAIRAAKTTATGLYLIPVENDEGGVTWYVYDEDSDNAVPYMDIVIRQDSFVILPLEKDTEVPEGLREVRISYAGQLLPAWIHEYAEDPNMYVVYGENSDQTKGFYRFDGTTGLFFRYVEDATLPETTTETEAPTDNPSLVAERDNYSRAADLHQTNFSNLQKKYNKEFMMGIVALGVCGLLLLLFLLLIIVQSSKLRKARKELEDKAEKSLRRPGSDDRARRKKPEAEEKAAPSGRSEHREDGTSAVRKAKKENDPRLERSTTTSAARRVEKKKPGEEAEKKQARPAARNDADDEPVYSRPVSHKNRQSAEEGMAIRESGDISGTGEPRRVKKEVVDKAPVKKPTRAAAVSELDELEDMGRAAADTVQDAGKEAQETADELFQASSSSEPELDTAGLERIAEQLKRYNLGDDLPDEDELPDLDEADDGDDSDFAVTDFKDI